MGSTSRLRRWLAAILHFPLTRACIATGAVVGLPIGVLSLAAYGYAAINPGAHLPVLVRLILVLAAVHISYSLYVRVVEGRAATEISPRTMLPDLPVGELVGAGLCGVVVGTLWMLGCYRVERS